MGHREDLSGKRFGKLVVMSYTGNRTQGGNAIWLCKCDCGNLIERDGGRLKLYKTPSCGCYAKEHASTLNKTHGGRHERLYNVWKDMRRRCQDRKDANFKNYGGRGISICDDWQDYAKFRKWAIDSGYNQSARSHECTLDRINVNENYCPENCRWVDSKTQQNNKRCNRMITYGGKTQSLKLWSEELNVRYGLLVKRIDRGWSFERAVSEPPQHKYGANKISSGRPV